MNLKIIQNKHKIFNNNGQKIKYKIKESMKINVIFLKYLLWVFILRRILKGKNYEGIVIKTNYYYFFCIKINNKKILIIIFHFLLL